MAFPFSGEIWAMEPKLSLDRVRRLLGGQCRPSDESRRTALCPEAVNTEVPTEWGHSRAGRTGKRGVGEAPGPAGWRHKHFQDSH